MSDDATPPIEDEPRLAPAAAISKAVRSAKRKVPMKPVTVAAGIGSAALVAALLYANRRKPGRDKG